MEASNVKAMREALEDSQSLLESFSHGEYGAQVREQMRDNQAALSAPPRNCDRFKTIDEAIAAFNDYDDTEGFRFSPSALRFCEWLFATADAKEGGSE